jgi:hypothetical protein
MSKPIKKQRWSNIDVFGLIKGLGIWDTQYKTLQYVRRPFDTTLSIKDKILRLNDDPPSLTKQGILNGLCAEFGFTPYNTMTSKVFPLTYSPVPSGAIGVQDVWVKARAVGSTGVWLDLIPQVWPSGYEAALATQQGFIVWTNENYLDISGYKNFNYNSSIEIISPLDNETEIQITYNVAYVDELNDTHQTLFTDANNANNPNDTQYVFRKTEPIAVNSGITVYSLSDIPSGLESRYFNDEGHATEQLYTIKSYFNKMYRSTWDKISNNSTIWDIQDIYCSGEIPNFFDAYIPKNDQWASATGIMVTGFFDGYIDGIDPVSNALYLSKVTENNSANKEWYPTIYPGKFYLDGISFRLFEDPVSTGLIFVNGIAALPSGLTRGMYTILTKSGYYNDSYAQFDDYLSGIVYEDYCAPCGPGGDELYGYIYRRRPHLTANVGYDIVLKAGEYNIDFENGLIYLNAPDTTGFLVWDRAIVPSGRIIEHDLNPLNQQYINTRKFFFYIGR